MIPVLAILATVATFSVLIFKPAIGVLVAFLCKPFVDAGYSLHVGFGFQITEIVGVGVPVLLLFHMVFSTAGRPQRMTLIWVWAIFLFVNLVGFSVFVAKGRYLFTINQFFRIINGFVGFYMLQTYITDRQQFRRFLIVLLIAGLFPMLMGVYQAATGHIWHFRTGTMGLVRNVGLYHNATSFRYFAYMTITAILLYWSYFGKRDVFQRILFLGYGAACAVVLFKVYSKAAVATMALWVIIWSIMNRRFGFLGLCVLAVLVANTITGNLVFEQIGTVFMKEAAVAEGQMETELMFSGRFFGWKAALAEYSKADIFNQLFGMGLGGGGTHNDYLRALLATGIVGLLAYLLLLGTVGFYLSRNMFFNRSPLNIMAFMIFVGYLVDTVGLNPSLYTGYQWYAWGFMGLALHGVPELDREIPSAVYTSKTPSFGYLNYRRKDRKAKVAGRHGKRAVSPSNAS
jgi:hypothetical protein